VREVRITGVAGGERTVRPDAAGMFLLVTEPGALRSTRAVPSRPRGGIVRVRLAGPLDGGALGPRVLAGSERIETTAPNPLGGPAWALVAGRTRAGRWCVLGQAQTIGDRYGAIETSYGTFDTVQLGRHCHTQPPPPTRQNPVMIGIGYSSTQSPRRDVLVRRARIERRVPTGMQVFSAVCDDSVERVTIRTPQDIRTLVPSPRAHAILALYAGTPVAGDTVITAHLRDGTTRRQRLPGLF
jgi:hypothetical protein